MTEEQAEVKNQSITLRIGCDELIIRQRYEFLSIFNYFMIVVWFLAGSVLFLFPAQETLAVWMFIIGSFQFLMRPAIRLMHLIHLRRLPNASGYL